MVTRVFWIALFASLFSFVAAKEVLVYAVINEADIELFAEQFTEQTGIEVRWLRGSTGEIVSRVRAERSAPQADILLGGPSAQHISLKDVGALARYVSPLASRLPEWGVDPEGYWTGFYLTALGIGINEQRFAEKFGDTAPPATWDDLLNPVFAGEIVMTDPAASSTAYLFLQAQLQRLGADAGWEYLTALAPLVGQFPSSGGAPPQLVGTGEYAIGVAYLHALARYRNQGFPVETIVPPLTAGEVGSVSVIAGGPNPEAAHAFIDYILSTAAQEAFAAQSFTTPLNVDAVLPPGVRSSTDYDLLDYDAEQAGHERDAVLERWQQVVD